MAKQHILVIGCGSVGRRHARNFHSLGCDISGMDPRDERLNQLAGEVPLQLRFTSLESALENAAAFTGIGVCSPPNAHVAQSIAALDAGLPVLLEKPVSPELQDTLTLFKRVKESDKLLLGYTYRWWEPVRRLKQLIDSGKVGALRRARFLMSAHLADWHPWESYQSFFMASREMGGGALLDESHFIDLMIWFFGKPERLFARVEKISNLEITTDDFVEISAIYPGGLRVSIQLDLIGRPHQKEIAVVGENGTIQCRFDPNEIRFGAGPEQQWETESFVIDRNDMFMAVAREFVELVEGKRLLPGCGIRDGLNVLQVIEACRESQRASREIALSEVAV